MGYQRATQSDGALQPRVAAQRLLDWYDPAARSIPWRADPEPYHILVAEFMLQQTRMETVLPRLRRFMKRWPTITSLADAEDQQVLAEWSGLGYYQRARNLLAACRTICAEHDGQVPRDPESLAQLAGVGPYMAGAIASTAFNVKEPAVDGNVLRVVGRLLRLPGSADRASYRRAVDGFVRRLLAHGAASDLNQALMDLGRMVCTPRSPDCRQCPLEPGCSATRTGHPETIPLRTPTARTLHNLVAVLAWRGDHLLVEPITGHGVLEGLWAPPLRQRAPTRSTALAPLTHTFSHQRWKVVPHVSQHPPGKGRHGRWVTVQEFSELPTSKLGRRLVEQAMAHRS